MFGDGGRDLSRRYSLITTQTPGLKAGSSTYNSSSFQFSRNFFTSAMNWSATAPSMTR
jgi:hypothetical protein